MTSGTASTGSTPISGKRRASGVTWSPGRKPRRQRGSTPGGSSGVPDRHPESTGRPQAGQSRAVLRPEAVQGRFPGNGAVWGLLRGLRQTPPQLLTGQWTGRAFLPAPRAHEPAQEGMEEIPILVRDREVGPPRTNLPKGPRPPSLREMPTWEWTPGVTGNSTN